ncbi:recombinase family protein [Peribacillus frigoritolerans]|uniref:recombinase family protein n=1 Tax=Peribacillus frigoritolerans TaxID=450367 RepID=UPI002EA227EC|nr:recombinase family protein [Peribacillus frigoritolerans]
MIKHVGILLRISRESTENADTLLSHRTIAERYMKEHGYTYQIYEEVKSGASNIANRTALLEMLADVEADKLDAVFVVSIDRISRDTLYAQMVAKVIADADIPVITPEKTYDLNSDDRLLFDIQNVVSSQELRLITKRQRSGKREHIARGQWAQGVAPFGYKRNEDNTSPNYKHLEINPTEADVVRMIFTYAIAGNGIPTIIDKLAGYTTRSYTTSKGKYHTGKPFSISMVNTILKNRVYVGEVQMQIKDKRKNVVDVISTVNAHEAIIDTDTFEKAQEAVAGRLSGGAEGLVKRNRSRGECLSILKDLVYCNRCGSKMGFRKDSKQQDVVYLKACPCGNKGATESRLLEEFYNQFEFTERYFTEQWEKALATPMEDSKEVLQKQLKQLQEQQDKLNRKLTKIRSAYLDEVFTKEEYLADKTATEEELMLLKRSTSDLERQLVNLDTKDVAEGYAEKLKLIHKVKEMVKDNPSLTDEVTTRANTIEANRMLKVLLDKIYYQKFDEKVIGSDAMGNPEVDYNIIEVTIAPK